MRLILASASPRRIELIKKLNYLEVIVRPSSKQERTDKTIASEIAIDLAREKAFSVDAEKTDLVLGADTIVVIDGKILGKPKDSDDARRMFKLLSGRTHSVITGICLKRGDSCVLDYCETYVEFSKYNAEIIDSYVRSGMPLDKAGGYGLQDEELSPIIKRVTGDYDNVLGLPVELVSRLIRENFYG